MPSQASTDRRDRDPPPPAIRRVSPRAPLRWLAAGWGDFRAAPVPSLLYGLLFGNASVWVLWSARNRPELAVALFTGLLLVGQLLAVGLYAGAAQRERGLPVSAGAALRALAAHWRNLGLLALALGLIMLLWVGLAALLLAAPAEGFSPSVAAYVQLLRGDGGALPLARFVLSGFVLAAAVFVCSAIAAPRIVDCDARPLAAMALSLRAFAVNPLPMSCWAVLIVALSGLGIVPFFAGMWVIFPVLGYATWHSYRDLLATSAPTGAGP